MAKKFFSFKPSDVQKVVKGLASIPEQIAVDFERKLTLATKIVWTTARIRRPKMTVAELKATGARRYFRNIDGKRREYRVSDPKAKLGVPVDTGELRESIKKDVKMQGLEKGYGIIYSNSPYATAIEYGTSRIAPRPFMRQAMAEQGSVVKKILLEKPKLKI